METLAALALFAMSTATVGEFLVTELRAAGSNASHTIAYELGIQKLESIRSLPYDQISSRSEQSQKGGLWYAIATVVENDVPQPEMKRITVDVAWNDPDGTRHVVLETIDAAVTH